MAGTSTSGALLSVARVAPAAARVGAGCEVWTAGADACCWGQLAAGGRSGASFGGRYVTRSNVVSGTAAADR